MFKKCKVSLTGFSLILSLSALLLIAPVFGAVFLLIPLQASADDIDSHFVEIYFEAEIDWDESDGSLLLCLDPNITTLTGSYTYDAEVTGIPYFPDSEDVWRYYQDTEYYRFRIEAEGFSARTKNETVPPGEDSNYAITIFNNYYGGIEDRYTVYSANLITYPEYLEVEDLSIRLTDFDGLALDSTGLTESAPILGDWDRKRLVFYIGCEAYEGYWLYVEANLTEMEKVEQVFDLVLELEDLIGTEALNSEQELGLYQKAASAMEKLDDGKTQQGCNQLYAFICQLEALLEWINPPYDELAVLILDEAYVIFGENCDVEEITICPMTSE